MIPASVTPFETVCRARRSLRRRHDNPRRDAFTGDPCRGRDCAQPSGHGMWPTKLDGACDDAISRKQPPAGRAGTGIAPRRLVAAAGDCRRCRGRQQLPPAATHAHGNHLPPHARPGLWRPYEHWRGGRQQDRDRPLQRRCLRAKAARWRRAVRVDAHQRASPLQCTEPRPLSPRSGLVRQPQLRPNEYRLSGYHRLSSTRVLTPRVPVSSLGS